MTDVADPFRALDVVLPAGLADFGPAHLAEGAAVHDAAELCAASGARPGRVGGPHHATTAVAAAAARRPRRGGQNPDRGAAPLDLLKLGP